MTTKGIETVSSPVIEAVQRVKCAAWAFVDPPGAAEDIAQRAAREALAPLRDLHKPTVINCVTCPVECDQHEDECPDDHPVKV